MNHSKNAKHSTIYKFFIICSNECPAIAEQANVVALSIIECNLPRGCRVAERVVGPYGLFTSLADLVLEQLFSFVDRNDVATRRKLYIRSSIFYLQC